MRCVNCGSPVESDGHGEVIHVNEDETPGKYGCTPGVKGNVPYPVARVDTPQ